MFCTGLAKVNVTAKMSILFQFSVQIVQLLALVRVFFVATLLRVDDI